MGGSLAFIVLNTVGFIRRGVDRKFMIVSRDAWAIASGVPEGQKKCLGYEIGVVDACIW